MKSNYKLLIIGDIYSVYMTAFVKYLKAENSDARVDFISLKHSEKPVEKEALQCIDRLCTVPFKSRNRLVEIGRRIFGFAACFKKFVKGQKYDAVNIQMPKYNYISIVGVLEKITDNVVITPWGSDVHLIGSVKKAMIRPLYKKAKYVTGVKGIRFTERLKSTYSVKDEDIVDLKLGSELIDYFYERKDAVGSDEAKKRLDLTGRYVITCGHNARYTQQHLKIIDAVAKVKDRLPDNLTLLFPMTYGREKDYVKKIKDRIDELRLPAVFYESYLDNEQLFLLRQATDLFIHVQTIDAHSASVMEHIILDKKIINGAWVSYPDLEQFGTMPYRKVETVEALPEAIVQAYRAKEPVHDPALIEYVRTFGWKYQAKKWNEFLASIS